jgi:hypothetical protein
MYTVGNDALGVWNVREVRVEEIFPVFFTMESKVEA